MGYRVLGVGMYELVVDGFYILWFWLRVEILGVRVLGEYCWVDGVVIMLGVGGLLDVRIFVDGYSFFACLFLGE